MATLLADGGSSGNEGGGEGSGLDDGGAADNVGGGAGDGLSDDVSSSDGGGVSDGGTGSAVDHSDVDGEEDGVGDVLSAEQTRGGVETTTSLIVIARAGDVTVLAGESDSGGRVENISTVAVAEVC